MPEETRTTLGADTPGMSEGPLSVDSLSEVVHSRFSRKRQNEIPLNLVREVLGDLTLADARPPRRVPRLRIGRLVFTGTKLLKDGATAPIAYDQSFAPGVNVVLVRKNGAGKSTILKTIKLALTGDDSDYDPDVRGWIERVWLQFDLDGAAYTIHVSRVGSVEAYLISGHTLASTEVIREDPNLLDLSSDSEALQESLDRFFMHRLGLARLRWTQDTGTAAEERTTSWRTFFQALVIPGNSEGYLLLDPARSYGNQEGLILSTFLGLSLVEPLNELLVAKQQVKKRAEVGDQERSVAEDRVTEYEGRLREAGLRLEEIFAAQRARRSELQASPSVQRVFALRSEQASLTAEAEALERERNELSSQIQRARAQARSLREAIALRLHFTGLEVSLCPNCDHGVEVEEVRREREEHLCRLCGKPAAEASAEDLRVMEADAAALEADAIRDARTRDGLTERIRRAGEEAQRLEAEARSMEAVLRRGLDYAMPTSEEEERRSELEQGIGEFRAQIVAAQEIIERFTEQVDKASLSAAIQEKARLVLREEADRMNESVLGHLGRLTEDMASRIGAASITDVTCSPLGRLALRKHQVKVLFGSIRNPGDRLRVKLAFFLAMMRLGRIQGAGRHPGFLMIDQPGSDEMIDANFVELARVLRDIDSRFSDDLQVICFTARPQFEEATADGKVYGPQAGEDAF
jgi:hypothetical protein